MDFVVEKEAAAERDAYLHVGLSSSPTPLPSASKSLSASETSTASYSLSASETSKSVIRLCNPHIAKLFDHHVDILYHLGLRSDCAYDHFRDVKVGKRSGQG